MRSTPARAGPEGTAVSRSASRAGPEGPLVSPGAASAGLPADSMVALVAGRYGLDADEIEHLLSRLALRQCAAELVAAVADDDHLGVRDDLASALAHQAIDVRNLALDVLLV